MSPPHVSLAEHLKQATDAEHKRTEASPLLARLFDEPFSHTHYRQLLAAMLSFYRPLEAALTAYLDTHHDEYVYFPRTFLLEQDLSFACSLSDDAVPVILDAEAPEVNDLASLVGVLYVIEGAALGGALIRKHLSKHMDVECAARFFSPYGTQVKQHWETTREWINCCEAEAGLSRSAVVHASMETFILMRKALDDGSSISQSA